MDTGLNSVLLDKILPINFRPKSVVQAFGSGKNKPVNIDINIKPTGEIYIANTNGVYGFINATYLLP